MSPIPHFVLGPMHTTLKERGHKEHPFGPLLAVQEKQPDFALQELFCGGKSCSCGKLLCCHALIVLCFSLTILVLCFCFVKILSLKLVYKLK